MTAAERGELLDAVERVESELDDATDAGASVRPLVLALADLAARAVRVWLAAEPPPAE